METNGIKLLPEFEKAIADLGFTEFTDIQRECIPLVQQGKDVIGLSYTGSGKTAAFGFPSLEKINSGKGIQMLVIVPTRELCNQVAKDLRTFAKYRRTSIVEVYGGVSINPQMEALRKADAVVGTPGRLLDHLRRGTLDLRHAKILVLDEADKMFEMGFIEDINQILSTLPQNAQKLLFSATMSLEVIDLAKTYMVDPVKVQMEVYVDESKLTQFYIDTNRFDKFSILVNLIRQEMRGLILIFCGTRRFVDIIDSNLNKQGIKSEALHGGITQAKRNQVLDEFRAGKLDVLVASDVAARGLDIKNVNMVVNYDIPKTSQEYVHRIGRTARAGNEGKVISLLASEDHDNFRHVLQDRSLNIEFLQTPKFERVNFVMPQRQEGFRRGPPRSGPRRSGPQSRSSGPRREYGRQSNRSR